MAIELFTGKPGAGKTHHAVQRAMAAIEAGRPVYVSNMNGMAIPGAIPFDNPREWEQLPAGALLVVDEAQRYWRASRSMEIPPEVAAMETHRHLGIDFLLTTQQPTYLLKHLRGLIMPHTHHERLTKKTSRTYTWANRCVEDPEAQGERELSQEGIHILTTGEFKRYTSTEQDTHKPKIPRRAIMVAAMAVVVIGLLWWVNKRVENIAKPADDPGTASVPAQPGQMLPGSGRTAAVSITPAAYFERQTPRHPGMPWSAPLYDDREPVAEPEIYCMTGGAGVDASGKHRAPSHTCITEQGTRVDVSAVLAADLAKRGGVHNPFRQMQQAQQGPQQAAQPQAAATGAGQRPAAMPGSPGALASANAGPSFGQPTAYGAPGIGAY